MAHSTNFLKRMLLKLLFKQKNPVFVVWRIATFEKSKKIFSFIHPVIGSTGIEGDVKRFFLIVILENGRLPVHFLNCHIKTEFEPDQNLFGQKKRYDFQALFPTPLSGKREIDA